MFDKIDYCSLVLQNIKLERRLRPLQFQVTEKLKRKKYVFVFDEVGCGKTIEAGIAIWNFIKDDARNILVVAPSNLVYNWYTELLSKFGLDFKIIEGNKNYIDIYSNNTYGNGDYINEVCSIENFCIAANASNLREESNAALDRLSKYRINWDLIIIDEGHEEKNDLSARTQMLMNFKARNVLFLSATPVKNIANDFDTERKLVDKILNNSYNNSPQFNIMNDINNFLNNSGLEFPEASITFNLDFPFTRSFKEIMSDMGKFKVREINTISYTVDKNLQNSILSKYKGLGLDRNLGCIWLFQNAFDTNVSLKKIFGDKAYGIYRKAKYSDSDLKVLLTYDNKINSLLTKLDIIINSNDRVLIFCNHIEVVEFLKKVLTCRFGSISVEAIHGKAYSKEERKHRMFLIDSNDSEMSKKQIVILSHNVGAQGINFSKFAHIFNYELTYTPGDLEQRFGRIDRITNANNPLKMYIFEDTNVIFDKTYSDRIICKMNGEVLPFIPSKNLTTSFNNIVNTINQQIEKMLNLYNSILGKNISQIYGESGVRENIVKYLSIRIHNQKKDGSIQITDVENKVQKTVQDIVNDLEKWLVNFFNKIGISTFVSGDLSTIPVSDLIYIKIQKFVNDSKNNVTYEGQLPQPHLVVYSYNDLIMRTKNALYNHFEDDIWKLQMASDYDAAYLKNYYIDNGLDALLKNIRQEIMKLSNTMQFTALYGVWKSIGDKKIDFVDFMGKYNGRI